MRCETQTELQAAICSGKTSEKVRSFVALSNSTRVFLLRRGPLLGPILQHPDDIDYVRCLFIHANFEDSKRIMEPLLLMKSPSLTEQGDYYEAKDLQNCAEIC
jgi:hypothetical protein